MRYSVQPRDRIFVIGYWFLPFAINMGKNINKNVNGKNSPGMLAMRQKHLDHAKKSVTNAFKNFFKKINSKSSWSNWWFDQ